MRSVLNQFMDHAGEEPEIGSISPISGGKTSSPSSPKRKPANSDADFTGSSRSRSKRGVVQKWVVTVPTGEAAAEGWKMKGEGAPPPPDSWQWRKYGQKPIKGSPYPRGYYRCSSSKGCPARKQVERSRADPTMLLVTYACDHNHPHPNPHANANAARSSSSGPNPSPLDDSAHFSSPAHTEPDDDPFGAEALLVDDVFDVAIAAHLESPICSFSDAEFASLHFPIDDGDDSLFADLGELPECSLIFGHRRLHDLADGSLRETPCCGTT